MVFDDLALEMNAVKSGRVDAAINDNGVVLDFAKDNKDTAVTKEFSTGEQYGVGVQEGRRQRHQAAREAQRLAGQGQERRQLQRDLQEVVRHRAGQARILTP